MISTWFLLLIIKGDNLSIMLNVCVWSKTNSILMDKEKLNIGVCNCLSFRLWYFVTNVSVSRTKDSPQGNLTKAISQTLNSNIPLLIQESKQESSDAIKCECNVMMLWPSQGLYLSTTSSDVRKKGSQLRLLKEHQNSHIQTFQPNTKTEMTKKGNTWRKSQLLK